MSFEGFALADVVWTRPGWLLVLPLALGLWCWLARRPAPAAAFPAWMEAEVAGALPRDPQALLSGALRLLVLVTLVLALAGPTVERSVTRDVQRGLDLVLVVDASGSMRALDARVAGEKRRRLDLAREVVARFATHRVGEGDRVGLVVFGDTAFTLCPLTHDGVLLEASLERLSAGIAGEATALGDALALAVKRVSRGELEASSGGQASPVAGRVVVLLTDGRVNAGAVPVDVAEGLARSTGTRVHTVGIGDRGEVAMASRHGEGREVRLERHDLDRETLARIAEGSGGRFFHARSAMDLANVYADIDTLERIEREAPPRVQADPRPEPFLGAAALLLLIEISTSRGFARRIP